MTEYLITIYHKGTQIRNEGELLTTPCSIITEDTAPFVMELSMKGIDNYTIVPDPPSASTVPTYSGSTISGPSGEALSFGDVCYFKSDGKFYKADSNTEATTKGLVVICIETTLPINRSGYFLTIGLINNTGGDWNWTTGDMLYISKTAGSLDNAFPPDGNYFVRIVGYAKDSDSIWFKPDTVYLKLV